MLIASNTVQPLGKGSHTHETTLIENLPGALRPFSPAFEIQPTSLALKPLRRFAACARRHGLAKTPDPKTVGGKVVLMLPHGYLRKNPRIKSAERSCKRFIPAGGSVSGQGPTTTRPTGTQQGPTTTKP